MKRLLAIGDIHGCVEALHKLINQKLKLTQEDKLVLLGDYIDRGKNSKDVVDYILELLDRGFDLVPLLGNHETLFLDALVNNDACSKWLINGGNETLKSFYIHSITEIPTIYPDFFRQLPLLCVSELFICSCRF